MVERWFGTKSTNSVIRNGVKQNQIKKFTIPAFAQIRSNYKLVFSCSANWHGQKRLNKNIDLFKHLRSTLEPSSCLLILGNNPTHLTADKDIFYLNSVPQNICQEIYSMSDWFLHLAWCDHMPNVVIHALSQETPVICSECGGTKEIVENYGLILKEKYEYHYELYDYDNPPDIDITQIKKLPNKIELGKCPIVNITQIAKQYVDFFERIL